LCCCGTKTGGIYLFINIFSPVPDYKKILFLYEHIVAAFETNPFIKLVHPLSLFMKYSTIALITFALLGIAPCLSAQTD